MVAFGGQQNIPQQHMNSMHQLEMAIKRKQAQQVGRQWQMNLQGMNMGNMGNMGMQGMQGMNMAGMNRQQM